MDLVNRRRIWRALETLKADSSLASVALDLGFSSQSHFTHIFSGLPGMTRAKCQKQFRRTVWIPRVIRHSLSAPLASALLP